jgi:hypothetical protein
MEGHSMYPGDRLLRKKERPHYRKLYKIKKECIIKEMRKKIVDSKRKGIETGFKFESNDNKITSIDLTSLDNVTIISDDFLNNYYNLRSINLSPLSKVKLIGNNFLQNCNKLIEIDLIPLSNLDIIGDNFLNNCFKLQKIKFTQSQMIKFISHNITTNDYGDYSDSDSDDD